MALVSRKVVDSVFVEAVLTRILPKVSGAEEEQKMGRFQRETFELA